MGIKFIIDEENNYFQSIWEGVITDSIYFQSYYDFFLDGPWRPGLNELCDLSRADLSQLTRSGIDKVLSFSMKIYRERGVGSVKVAVFAPRDMEFGWARVYDALSDISPELLKVCREYGEALQ